MCVSQIVASDGIKKLTSLSKGNDVRTSFCFGVDQVNILRLLIVCSLFVSLIEKEQRKKR